MKMNEYQQLTERTAPQGQDIIHNMIYGLNGETGELTDFLKKVFFHGHEMDKDHVKKELGDILWYLARIAAEFDLTLGEVAAANIVKLMKRYPEGFREKDSVNREEYNENTRRYFF